MSDEQMDDAPATDHAAALSTALIILTTLTLGGAIMVMKAIIDAQYKGS